MPAKDIKELRQAGKLQDALNMAKAELQADPDNIWPKRNISWVYYDYLKITASVEHFDLFISWLAEVKKLQLPSDEKMLYDQLSWQIGKMVFSLLKPNHIDVNRLILLFGITKNFDFPKHSEGYSFLYKAFHKGFKETDEFIQFADWWDFKNFRAEDFQKEKMPNGKEFMSIAEQAYITYAKHLLPRWGHSNEFAFDREKAEAFLPKLTEIEETHADCQYPAYFKAKLLLALGDKNNMLSALLPFAKRKKNDFWVWEILGEAFNDAPNKKFACYCKALTCNSPDEMLVGLRQKIANIFIAKGLYNEAKTEIILLVAARISHEFKIPNEVVNWQEQEWYKNAIAKKSNLDVYKQYIPEAESILFADIPEEYLFVDFVNTERKILNFIASDTKFGFFKYERFFRDVKVGDIIKVRFQGGSNEGIFQAYTAVKTDNEEFKKQFAREIEGDLRIQDGKPFGFLNDVFVHPSVVTKRRLTNGMHLKGTAIKSYNQEKKQWGWKLI